LHFIPEAGRLCAKSLFVFSAMKIFARVRDLMLVATFLIAAGWRAEGQNLSYSVTSSATTLLVSNSLAFSINITNFTGITLYNLVVTDSLPASVNITSANPNGVNYNQISDQLATFELDTILDGAFIQVTLNVQPTQPGLFTNTVTVTTASILPTQVTNLVVDVTNVQTIANLGVALTSPAQPVIVNDFAAYGITVTNAGPDTAPQVMLTNTLPPGSILEGVSPANLTFTTNPGGNLIFNLGDIGSGGSSSLQVTVSPTNAGVLTYYAAVDSASVTNISTLSTLATNSLTVLPYLTNVLIAVTHSGQSTDFQNGLEEQSILLTNISATNIVTAARVAVSGLHSKQLYNAVGTNNGQPYVTYTAPQSQPLAPGQSMRLLLQYNPRGSFTFSNSQLQAYPVPVPNLTPPPATATSKNINISGIFKLADGNMLVEFPATTGRTYTVVYSDNVRFSNAMIAPPAIAAPANILQWIDYGPPATVSTPTNTGNRFYRVIQNP
jgi:uncharacterized repeat protein (TIGR01451 family)